MPRPVSLPAAALPTPQRLAILDVLRGAALTGIPVLNAPAILHLNFEPGEQTVSTQVQFWSDLLFRGHFFPLFALLFGAGFGIMMERAQQRGESGLAMFLRRLALLFGLGLLHSLLQSGEALRFYALFGLLLIPCSYLPVPLIGLGAAVMTVLALWTSPILLTPAMFLLGLALQRLRAFEQPQRVRPVLRLCWRVLPRC
ncbi:hypothetical protein [Deinococcus radiophilus]|uniref:hypothetical protein n=1 Tax=Deinococcus radiophilus TaxID=32062 RepID=UPI003614DDDE